MLLIDLKAATLLKKRLWHRCVPVNFVKFLGTTFYIELFICVTAFGLSFVNRRNKSEGTSLVKFLLSCHFNIK